MLNIKTRIYIHFFVILSAVFIIMAVAIEGLVAQLPKNFWLSYLEVVAILYGVSFYVLAKMVAKIQKDMDALTHYLEELNDKHYDAQVHIHHTLELLQASLLLKNLVKRIKKPKSKL